MHRWPGPRGVSFTTWHSCCYYHHQLCSDQIVCERAKRGGFCYMLNFDQLLNANKRMPLNVWSHTHTYTCPHKCRWLTFSCLAVLPSPGDGPANNYKKQTCLWLTRSCISLFVVHCFSTLPLFTLKSSMSFSFSSTASFSLFTSAFSVSLASWRHLTKAERRVKQRNINRDEE